MACEIYSSPPRCPRLLSMLKLNSFVGCFVLLLCFAMQFLVNVLSIYKSTVLRKRGLIALTYNWLITFLLSCGCLCSMFVGLSVVCDGGISWSHSVVALPFKCYTWVCTGVGWKKWMLLKQCILLAIAESLIAILFNWIWSYFLNIRRKSNNNKIWNFTWNSKPNSD